MSSHRPSKTEAWDILQAAGPPEWVIEHVSHVEQLATAMADAAIANGQNVDRNLVQVGAILHDVGRAQTQDARHAHIGAEFLRTLDMDEDVVAIVERHTGAGILADEASELGLPVKDYTPQTLEEQLVAHADNLLSGSKRLTMEDVATKYRAKGLDAAYERIQTLHEFLCDACGTDLTQLTVPESG